MPISRTTLRNVWEKGDGPAREVFDDGVLPPTIDGNGSRSGARWREFERLLEGLKAARSEVFAMRAEAERFDSKTPDPPEFDDPHVSNFHTRGEVTFTVAEPERGKTLLAVLNALAVAHERPDLVTDQFRHDLTEVNDWAGAVVLVLNETSGRAQQLLRAAEAINGLKRTDMKHPIFVYRRHLVIAEKGRNDVVEPSQGLLEFLRWLTELRREEEIALVVFDTLSSMTAGLPENSAEAMSIVTEIFDKIAKACFAAVDVLHHTAKQSRETGGFAPRGSGALGAAARSIRTIELAGEGGSRLLKVRPLKLSNRGRGPDEHFEIEIWKRQVERARRRGEFRMAGAAGLKRLTAAALRQAKDDAGRGSQRARSSTP